MSANIFGNRFWGARVPAWHNLGKVFEGDVDIEEALGEAGIGYKVNTVPLYIQTGGGYYRLSGKVGSVRWPTMDEPVYELLGAVNPKFTVVQNAELAAQLKPLTKKWPVETIGSLGKGEKVFFTLRAGDAEIGGDKINKFFLVTDTKDGTGGLEIAFTPIRVVCQNTLIMAMNTASARVSLAHGSDLASNLTTQLGVVRAMQRAEAESLAELSVMADTIISEDEAKGVLERAYPVPAVSSKMGLVNAVRADSLDKETRDAVVKMSVREQQKQGNLTLAQAELREKTLGLWKERYTPTAWGIYNAVVEMEDFGREKRGARGAVFGGGARIKQAAFKAAQAVR